MTNKIAQFHFELEDSSKLTISYNLLPNRLTKKWIDIVSRRKGTNNSSLLWENLSSPEPLELKITNKTSADSKFLIDTLNNIVQQINGYYDKPLPILQDFSKVDRDILNYLHEEFEEYGERNLEYQAVGYKTLTGNPNQYPGNQFKEDFHQLWLDLNQWIHITESAIDQGDFPNFSCLIQYLPFEEHGSDIEEIDKLFLTLQFDWGGLYLGYNTLGKDYMHTQHDNDIRVIVNEQVKVQQKMSSEVWLNFSASCSTKSQEMNFYNWYSSLDEDIQQKIPTDNLNNLALGRYYIGQVIINDVFLKFHPRLEDWIIPNSEIKKQWDLDVFSKIVKVTGISIKDD